MTPYEYNRWANARILDAAAQLSEEQFARDLRSSHVSVRATLVHIMGGEWIWLMRRQGTSPRAMFNPAEFPTVAALRARWTKIEHEQAAFVANVTDESLRQEIRYMNLRGESYAYPLWQMMHHAPTISRFFAAR